MRKRFLWLALATALSAMAHHGYSEYDREALVSMEGTVTHIMWGNPHVLITLQTEHHGEYSVEWAAVFQLLRWGIDAAPVRQGDRVIITGSINRNPDKHILTLVRKVCLAGGRCWADPRYSATE